MNNTSSVGVPISHSSTARSSCIPAICADLHSHTSHSHGQASTDAMYLAAKARGLKIFGYSEHSPRPEGYTYPTDYQEKLMSGFSDYVQEVERLKLQGMEDGITVLLALEVDYIPGHETYAQALCDNYPYDYIIGGLHFQGAWGFDFTAADWDGYSQDELFAIYEQYYTDLAAMCRTGLFHIAAHPDLIKIFTVNSFSDWLQTPDALDAIYNALSVMKEYGVILEISSAGLRKPCKEIYPGPVVMSMAAELGLPISFGSDAHCTNTPAFAFDNLARYAAGYGYTTSMVFEKGTVRPLAFTAPSSL